MGVMEQILDELKVLNEKIDSLPAAGGGGRPELVEGKAVLSADELADLLGVSPQTVRDQSRQGRIPFVEVASVRRYPITMIRQWMQEESVKNYTREKELETTDIDFLKFTS